MTDLSRSRQRRGARRYGVLLDGGALTMVCVEGDEVVAADHLHRATPVEALSAWLAERRPREPVTVSLVAPSEETAEVQLSEGLGPDAMREVIRDRVSGHFAKDAGPFAVVARLREDETGVLARVAAIPQRLVEGLWRIAKPNVRFTLPAMTYTTDGLHLAICETSADLFLVDGGQVRESVALACGGRRADGGAESDLSEYADRVAEEVVQARNSWLRRRLDVAYDRVAVSGAAVPQEALGPAFLQRGIQVSVDRVTERLPGTAAVGEGDATVFDLALAAAAAVVDAGPVGYLDDVVRRRRRRAPALPGQPVEIDRRLRLALPIAVVAGVIAVAAAAIVPSLNGASTLDAAQSAHAQAQAEQAHYSADISLYHYNEQLKVAVTSQSPLPWGTIAPAIVATVPPGITLSNLSLTGQGQQVKVTAQATASQTSLIPRWLSTLQRRGIVPSVAGVSTGAGSSASSKSTAPGAASFTASFTVPRSFS
jgi:Tfp pilus assembly protein PilN